MLFSSLILSMLNSDKHSVDPDQLDSEAIKLIRHARIKYLMAFRWQVNDVPLIVVLGSSLPSSTKKK